MKSCVKIEASVGRQATRAERDENFVKAEKRKTGLYQSYTLGITAIASILFLWVTLNAI